MLRPEFQDTLRVPDFRFAVLVTLTGLRLVPKRTLIDPASTP